MKIGRLSPICGADAGSVFLLKNLTVFEGGRSPGNHVLLKDPSVAMSHFRICRHEDVYSIYDLGSKNGTLVNGELLEKADLNAGDVIQVGEVQMAFDLVDDDAEGRAASSAPALEDLEAMRARRRDERRPRGEDRQGVAHPADLVATGALLEVVEGDEQGQVYALSGKRRFTIGRSKESDLRIRDSKVSRDHCSLEQVGDHHIVVDHDSSNGTIVNGERIKKTVLKEGDYIRLGFTILRFSKGS